LVFEEKFEKERNIELGKGRERRVERERERQNVDTNEKANV